MKKIFTLNQYKSWLDCLLQKVIIPAKYLDYYRSHFIYGNNLEKA